MKEKELEIHYVDINTLNEAEYNPRKITPKKKKELLDSMEKYGIIEPLKVNQYEGRENILISGHQRLKIAKELGYKQVPVTYEYLDEENERELNLRLNKNGGEFDFEMVVDMASRDLLMNIGFTEKELGKTLSEFEQKFYDVDTTEPVYPIIPKFNEKYDFVMIITKTEMDYTWLKNVLEITRKKDYKSEAIGDCKVLLVEEFQKLYKTWTLKS